MKDKLKRIAVQSIGIITTMISLVIIYLTLFKDGHLQELTTSVMVEFLILFLIAVSTRYFWYTSTENSVRSSQSYIDKRDKVTAALDEEINDAAHFDAFIEAENDANYRKYINNRCKNMTAKNYKLSLGDKLHRLFKKKSKKPPNEFYMNRYKMRVEHAAGKLHKLSGSSIRSLTQSIDGLIDDRNRANTRKWTYLVTTTIGSVILMFITALISFTNKQDIDLQQVILKMFLYSAQILFSILQSVLTAKMTVNDADIAYFNRIIAILELYRSFKKNNPEVNYVDDTADKETGLIDTVGGSTGTCDVRLETNATSN